MDLTKRQQEIFDFIKSYSAKYGYPPTVRDIGKEMRRLSKAGVRFVRYEGLGQDEHGVWHSPSGAKIAWFADPDGNTLSLTEHG